LINNRQGGRRRGRGGGGRAPNNVPSGNRQDHRQRGNAAQLLEKYKQLARDAQLGGDRVQSEYYLQFAEHYFRLLNENRARFEDQRRHRDDDYDDDEGDDELVAADGEDSGRDEERRPRDHRDHRDTRGPREDREPRAEGEQRNGEGRFEASRRRPRRDLNGDEIGRDQPTPNGRDEARIALDSLPPAISASAGDGDSADEEAPRPRRRTRRPRPEDAGDPAPAAA